MNKQKTQTELKEQNYLQIKKKNNKKKSSINNIKHHAAQYIWNCEWLTNKKWKLNKMYFKQDEWYLIVGETPTSIIIKIFLYIVGSSDLQG